MMWPKQLARIFLASFILLVGCNLGQEGKTVGTKSSTASTSNATNFDTFAVTMAYRNPSESTATLRRTVLAQGVTDSASAAFSNTCGSTATACTCYFYHTTSDSSPVTASTVGISTANNSISCVIPSSISDAQVDANYITHMKLVTTDSSNKNSGIIEIKNTLTITDVIGSSLSKTNVRAIYRYDCTRTFFEGEGVSPAGITCTASQRLGVINASYNYYIYHANDTTSLNPETDTTFSSTICGRSDFLKTSCSGTSLNLRYGLYASQTGIFKVGVGFLSGPSGQSQTYGYAALPDTAGNCPTGLIKVRPYTAIPASIISGTAETNSPPSSFINTGGTLNNTVVETTAPSNFSVNRSKNSVVCDAATGDCSNATFQGFSTTQSVAYSASTPIICVIPASLLSGLY